MDLQKYLHRIGFKGSKLPLANLETLRLLHYAHMHQVPFENLDIHYNRYIEVDVEKFYKKIVNDNRGGFCFELNGLFNWALRQIGFDVTILAAAVINDQGDYGIPLGHLTNLVALEGKRWLVDVGFGDNFVYPIEFVPDKVQVQKGRYYRLKQLDETYYQYAVSDDGGANYKHWWKFTLTPRQLDDFKGACHYMQTSPDTHFTHNRVCSVSTPQGRITLSDLNFKTRVGKEQTVVALANEQEFLQVLQEQFSIVLHQPYQPPFGVR
ncbi:arylamine N-acetyltransferase family protein [Microscilla marina]|uniref:Arylamine N-acetyltransferase 2 n=1 Tax=Microscilla marina ATCC 23134 TaxID=313606 RepID=A1ZLQ2_MICM2|nr:arylamine N-acetyltransferase [Microscilla marina]EAY28806.1 arylamine N-acetyltransferase 2 [Microscilla marina ATCC 23134]